MFSGPSLRRAVFLCVLPFISSLRAADSAAPVRPILFEPAPEGGFISTGGDLALRLTEHGVDLAVRESGPARLSFVGGSRVQPRPEGRSVAQSHYFLGSDAKRWRPSVANFEKIRYAGIYPGVDAVFYGNGREFEYDLLLAPGADPNRIRMRFDGGDIPVVNADGDLAIGNTFLQRRPVAAQDGNPVDAAFRLHPDGAVGIELGNYDRSRPLTIDPVLTYSSYLGGTWSETIEDITVDATGNVYVTGWTFSPNFPGPIVRGQAPNVRQFGFVTKYAPIEDGKTRLLFTAFFGDNADRGFVSPRAVRIDRSGNIILAGAVGIPTFPTVNAVQPAISGGADCSTSSGGQYLCADGFLTKLSPDGSTLLFSTYYGGRLASQFDHLALDALDGIYVLGLQNGPTALQGTEGAIQRTAGDASDILFARFSPAGQLLYSTFLGGNLAENGTAIGVEAPGIVWIGALTRSTNIPVTQDALQPTFAAVFQTGYIARIDTGRTGTAGLTYASFFGAANGNTIINGIEPDAQGRVLFCGATSAVIPVTATAFQRQFAGAPASRITGSDWTIRDGFVAQFDPSANGADRLAYSSFVGGTDVESVVGCTKDANGLFLVAGYTLSGAPFFTPGSPLPFKNIGSASNTFVARIDPSKTGSAGWVESAIFGGIATDRVNALAVDPSRKFAYVAGSTFSRQFPVSSDALQPQYGGDTTTTPQGIPIDEVGIGDSWLAQLDLSKPQIGVAALDPAFGNFQFGLPGQALPKPIAIQLVDDKGNPLRLPGYPIRFGSSTALFTTPNVVTDFNGVAGTHVMLPTLGDHTVTATLSPYTPATFRLRGADTPLPHAVSIVSGANQRGKAGTPLPQPLIAQLRRLDGEPLELAGITIVFKGNNATVSAADVVTDAQGRAQTTVTLTGSSGPTNVTVIVANLPEVVANFTVSGPAISAAGITHGATFQSGGVSPGLITTLFGSNIGPSTLVLGAAGSDNKFPTTLGATRVLFDGVPSPLIYASAGQTSVIVPYSVAGKSTVPVVVEYEGEASNTVTIPVVEARPGLFTSNASGSGQGAILNQDYSVNSASRPAQRGSYVALYGTGEGQTSPGGTDGLLAMTTYPAPNLPVRVRINGVEAEVAYAGAAPTLVAGVLQINVRIPAGTPDGNATIEVLVGTQSSPAVVTVAVQGTAP